MKLTDKQKRELPDDLVRLLNGAKAIAHNSEYIDRLSYEIIQRILGSMAEVTSGILQAQKKAGVEFLSNEDINFQTKILIK